MIVTNNSFTVIYRVHYLQEDVTEGHSKTNKGKVLILNSGLATDLRVCKSQ